MSRGKRRKSPVRRLLRALILLVLAAVLYSIVGGYLPFARVPELEDEAAILARAEEMAHDIDTADRAVILETSTGALNERIRLMAQAREEIAITTYECHDGESTRDLLAVALERAEAGVRVRFLADGIAGRLDIMGNDLFRAAAAHPNIEIRFYNLLRQLTPWRHMGRMHDKYMIADDTAYILGGRNMYDGFLGDYPTHRHRSHDREALVYNGAHGTARSAESSLSRLREYFEGVWSQADTTEFSGDSLGAEQMEALYARLRARAASIRAEKPDLFLPADYAAMTEATRGVWLISNPTTIYAKQPVVFAQLCALMATAKRDVIIHSPYAVLNGDMQEALSVIAAHVPVTLMVNAVENGANVVSSSDYLFHRGEVLSTGVSLLEYAGGISYHGKSIAIDDSLSVIGSYNLDLRSTYVDTELMLVIRSREINAQLRAHMAALHADCLRVTADGDVDIPEGLEVPALSPWKRAGLRALGAVIQLFRNLV